MMCPRAYVRDNLVIGIVVAKLVRVKVAIAPKTFISTVGQYV